MVTHLCNVTFGHMYCDLWISTFKKEYFPWKLFAEIQAMETIQGRKLFKGGNYLRKYGTSYFLDKLWKLPTNPINRQNKHNTTVFSHSLFFRPIIIWSGLKSSFECIILYFLVLNIIFWKARREYSNIFLKSDAF